MTEKMLTKQECLWSPLGACNSTTAVTLYQDVREAEREEGKRERDGFEKLWGQTISTKPLLVH